MQMLSREHFVARVREVVAGRFPLVTIEPEADSFSVVLNGHRASLENLYRLVAWEPEQLTRHVERWVVELLRAAEGRPDENATFEQVRDRILPMLLPTGGRDEAYDMAVSQPLIEGLSVAYAIDSDRTIIYLPKSLFATWKMGIEELHQTAIANLQARSSPLQAHAAQDESGRVSLIMFQTMDGYDASRILLPTLHEQLKQHLGSPFMAAVPNRDILVCFRNDAELIDRITRQVAEDFTRMPHQLTRGLFLITPDGIAPYASTEA